RPGEPFELHRGLSLVAHAPPAVEQRGDCVEEPAHAGGDRPRGALDEMPHRVAARVVDIGERCERTVALTGVRRPRQSHPPWFPDRRNTTRHRDRAHVADAYERGEVGDEEFAAP